MAAKALTVTGICSWRCHENRISLGVLTSRGLAWPGSLRLYPQRRAGNIPVVLNVTRCDAGPLSFTHKIRGNGQADQHLQKNTRGRCAQGDDCGLIADGNPVNCKPIIQRNLEQTTWINFVDRIRAGVIVAVVRHPQALGVTPVFARLLCRPGTRRHAAWPGRAGGLWSGEQLGCPTIDRIRG